VTSELSTLSLHDALPICRLIGLGRTVYLRRSRPDAEAPMADPHDDGPNKAAVTALLAEADAGNVEALDRLIPLVYDELRRIAHRSEEHTSELQSRENLVC